MAGHSKWANIQHRKNAQDAKRGKLFTKLIREITSASRVGGADPESNPRLRLAIDKAMDANMSKDTIDKAIKRGTGDVEGEILTEIAYEGYGPGGVAVLVECLTNNRNRTVAEVRHAFTKAGGNLGSTGSVAYLFKPVGLLTFDGRKYSEDQLLEIGLENGVEDVENKDDGSIWLISAPENYQRAKLAFQQANLLPELSEMTRLPATTSHISDFETAEKLFKMIAHLEDLDDVQNVYNNADIDDEIVDAL